MADIIRGLVDGTGVEVSNADARYRQSLGVDSSYIPMAGAGNDYINSPIYSDGTSITINAEISSDKYRDVDGWMSNVQNNTEMTLAGGSGLAHLKDNFYSHDNWNFFSPGKVGGLDTTGYIGGTFDGRYVYYVPSQYTGTVAGYHGNILRYDTVKAFDETSSYSAFNLATINALYEGYFGACFDGQYVYLSPYYNGTAYHGNVIQYNTRLPFNLASSYKAYDASGTSGLDTRGYSGCTFTGKYVYFTPITNGNRHGYVLRYNTEEDFTSSGSWSAYDASGTSGISSLIGFQGNPVYDGRYVYFSGTYDGANRGRVLRYDSSGIFTNSGSWSAFSTETVNANALNLKGGDFDGRFIYFYSNGSTLRYDTEATFDNTNSWTSFDRTGFSGSVFDGRYINFTPYFNGTDRIGTATRYDTAKSFTDNQAWEILDISQTSYGGSLAKGYNRVVYDKRYIYHVPYYNGTTYSNLIARYDTHSSGFYQDIKKAAMSKEFFMDSTGRIGIGTTSPDARVTIRSTDSTQLKITTDGTKQAALSLDNSSTLTLYTTGTDLTSNVEIKAHAFRDDYQGWLIDEAQKANLTLAINNGGSGGFYPLIDSFKRDDNWKFFDASTIDGLNTRGYWGGSFDGRYVYYSPHYNGTYHGNVMRYDITLPFDSTNSYDAYNMGSIGGLNTTGYSGIAYGGRYMYFAPYRDSALIYHGRVVRYDTLKSFTTASSYSVFDASGTSGLNTTGFRGDIYDGKYVYFSPSYNGNPHGYVLRYNTEEDFTSSGSWIAYDASGTSGLDTRGYGKATSDGRYIYFAPNNNGSNHGNALRYDSSGDFTNSGSWIAYNASNTDGLECTQFQGATFDGRFIYFYGRNAILRYDSVFNFTDSSAWSAIQRYTTEGLTTRGYSSGFFDGRYLHLIPEYNSVDYHGNALRYDTARSFYDNSSWESYDLTKTGGQKAKGFEGVAFDGRSIYLTPYNDDTNYSGYTVKYDAKSRIYNADIMKGAISKQFFLDGTGRLGLGTDRPTAKIDLWSTDATQLKINYNSTTQASLSLSNTGDLTLKTSGDDLNLIVDGTDGKITTNASFSADQAIRDHNSWMSNVQNNTEITLGKQSLSRLKDNFARHDNWDFFSIGKINGLDTSGYLGGTFDSRYVYYVPYSNGSGYHGNFLKYDTVKPFDQTTSYSAFNIATINSNYKGYKGACFDGQYIYLSPLNNGSFHGNVIQYNTRLPFNQASSYKAYDASGTSGLNTVGYVGCIFDSKYVYFTPSHNTPGSNPINYHCYVLRYNTEGDFTSSGSWTAYDASGTSGVAELPGLDGPPIFDGRNVYFFGGYNGADTAKVLKYDSSGDFTSSGSWSAFNAEAISPSLAFRGGDFDGRFIYLYGNGPTLRYDTAATFDNTNSWTLKSDMTGFSAATFDGRYVIFCPYYNGTDRIGTATRYDTAQSFIDNNAWQIIDISQASYGGSLAKGYLGTVYDKKHVYFIPAYNGSWFNLVARYKTNSSGFYQDIKKSALSKEFYMDSTGRIGIDTTAPTEKLDVNGNMKIRSGGYNNGHLLLGNYHLWIDSTGNLRLNNGAPNTDSDGTVVGTQS